MLAVVDASTAMINTTRCIQYAPWFAPQTPAATPQLPAARRRGYAGAARRWTSAPAAASVLQVASASQRVLVQERPAGRVA